MTATIKVKELSDNYVEQIRFETIEVCKLLVRCSIDL